MTTLPPTTGQWTPTHPTQPGTGTRVWQALGLAIAILLGAAALIVALTGPTTSNPTASPKTSAPPTYTAADIAAAHQKLCEVYKLAARAVQVETNGASPALAGVAAVNGALMLETTINTAPALASGDRAAALALAEAYSNTTATSSIASGRDDPTWRAALDDVNAKDARMKALCGVS
ncbi:hypothetical protein BST40_28095 [Mycobacterium persicum]|nr:hypothetical protein BST40_28095 [Mycobacterium persicum]